MHGLRAAAFAAALAVSAGSAAAQHAPAPGPATAAHLPPDAVSHHTITLPGRTLAFTATVGTLRPTDENGHEQAEIEFIAYTLDGAQAASRPVTFLTNGGPGSASGWLQLGAAGPWRVDLGSSVRSPSATPATTDNPDTWLDFTDLVFIDPAGTGWSRLADDNEATRRHVWSVEGDVDVLADTVRRWLEAHGRMASPKFFAGESYAGLRGPLLARALASRQGVALTGEILISPLLDMSVRTGALDLLPFASNLPSMAAVAHHLPPDALGPVEAYATGEYLADLLRGTTDPAVLDRMSARVADLTGLDPAVVRRHNGRVAVPTFLREHDPGAVDGIYDATINLPNPFPEYYVGNTPEPTFAGFGPLVASAMMELVAGRLNWHPDGTYVLDNSRVGREWDYGRGYRRPQAMEAMRAALASDPRFRVLIGHGVDDLITPYFVTKLLLSQLPNEDFVHRVTLKLHDGGHMFYTRDASRAALHEEARSLVTGP